MGASVTAADILKWAWRATRHDAPPKGGLFDADDVQMASFLAACVEQCAQVRTARRQATVEALEDVIAYCQAKVESLDRQFIEELKNGGTPAGDDSFWQEQLKGKTKLTGDESA